MTIDEVKKTLATLGVRRDAYDFSGSDTNADEVYCLDRLPGGWRVYYRERGIHREEVSFVSEDEACRHFLSLILRDPTTRR